MHCSCDGDPGIHSLSTFQAYRWIVCLTIACIFIGAGVDWLVAGSSVCIRHVGGVISGGGGGGVDGGGNGERDSARDGSRRGID